MGLDIQSEKIELIQWLTTLNDQSIIQQLIEIRKSESKDWWKDISISERKSIEEGIINANSANLKPQSEARKIYEKWL